MKILVLFNLEYFISLILIFVPCFFDLKINLLWKMVSFFKWLFQEIKLFKNKWIPRNVPTSALVQINWEPESVFDRSHNPATVPPLFLLIERVLFIPSARGLWSFSLDATPWHCYKQIKNMPILSWFFRTRYRGKSELFYIMILEIGFWRIFRSQFVYLTILGKMTNKLIA